MKLDMTPKIGNQLIQLVTHQGNHNTMARKVNLKGSFFFGKSKSRWELSKITGKKSDIGKSEEEKRR